jgi:oxygen-independent coproporphyrinogen-3 oxidase
MGYTVRAAPDMVACGLSGIGDVAGAYFQNHRKLHAYESAVGTGGLAAERGYVLTEDDRLRRHVISSLMCSFELDYADVERRFGVDFEERFGEDLHRLAPLEEDGLVRRADRALEVTETGRLFVRNVCMCFDAHLEKPAGRTPRWSRTV